MSAFTLHQVKSGLIPPPPVDDTPGSRVWYGKRMEPVIGQMAAEMFGWEIRAPGPFAVDQACAGMSASLDGIIMAPGERERVLRYQGPGLLEVKRAEWLAHKRSWENGEPPMQIVLQAQHGMACAGLTWGVVVVLVGELGLIAYRYPADPDTARAIRAQVAEFWRGVRDGVSPNPDATASSAAALKALFPSRVDLPTLDLTADEETDVLCFGLKMAAENLKLSTKVANGYKNMIRFALKGATQAETVNHFISAEPDKNGRVTLRVHEKPAAA